MTYANFYSFFVRKNVSKIFYIEPVSSRDFFKAVVLPGFDSHNLYADGSREVSKPICISVLTTVTHARIVRRCSTERGCAELEATQLFCGPFIAMASPLLNNELA